jgi:translocator protein
MNQQNGVWGPRPQPPEALFLEICARIAASPRPQGGDCRIAARCAKTPLMSEAFPPVARGSFLRAAVVFVPLLLFAGGLAARIAGSTTDNGWYQTLVLPAAQPPGPAFGIAWSILYTLLAVAAALLWASKDADGGRRGRGLALGLFGLGIVLNLAWSPLFFRAHLILPALVLIVAMFIVAVATVLAAARVNRLAAWLLVPYCAWLGFAGALNADIWRLNPAADAFQLEV